MYYVESRGQGQLIDWYELKMARGRGLAIQLLIGQVLCFTAYPKSDGTILNNVKDVEVVYKTKFEAWLSGSHQ